MSLWSSNFKLSVSLGVSPAQDFDLNQFDAFCLALEGDRADPAAAARPTAAGDDKDQYELLCDWLLEVGPWLQSSSDDQTRNPAA
jgi:hypothetical protein